VTVKTKKLTREVVDVLALYKDVGGRLRAARIRAGVSQEQVSLALGMTRANVSNLEAGRSRVQLEHIYNAALLFGRPVKELLP
jgi:transcriptional regulator with XRE-family HTH domain